jgi:hypothetical protein
MFVIWAHENVIKFHDVQWKVYYKLLLTWSFSMTFWLTSTQLSTDLPLQENLALKLNFLQGHFMLLSYAILVMHVEKL